ncbi:MAG: hypothetical protein ACE5GQ_03735, partial [Nitrospinales bacterium]
MRYPKTKWEGLAFDRAGKDIPQGFSGKSDFRQRRGSLSDRFSVYVPHPRKLRIAFYSHDTMGLGH